MPKKKAAVKRLPVTKNDDNLIVTIEDLSRFTDKYGLTPIEKVMAVDLLCLGIPYYAQFYFDLQSGVCMGKKYFILDFLLRDYNLAIECDGKVHYDAEHSKYDKARNNFLLARGYSVLRFDGNDIYENSKDYVKPSITEALKHLQKVDPKSRPAWTREDDIDTDDIPF